MTAIQNTWQLQDDIDESVKNPDMICHARVSALFIKQECFNYS